MEKQLSSVELDLVQDFLSAKIITCSQHISAPDLFAALKDKLPGQIEKTFVPAITKAVKEDIFPGYRIGRGRYGGIRLKEKVVSIKSKIEDVEVKIANPELTNKLVQKAQAILKPLEDESASESDESNLSSEDLLYKQIQEETAPLEVLAPKPIYSSVYQMQPPKQAVIQPKPQSKVDIWINDKQYQVPHSSIEIRSLLKNVLEAKEDEGGQIKFDGQAYACSDIGMDFLDKFLFFFYSASVVF